MKFENPIKNKSELEAIKELLIEKNILTKKEIQDKEKERREIVANEKGG